MAGELKKRGENQYKSDDEDRKRVVPPKVRTFLDWDAEITDYVTGMIQSKLPADVTKSETKFMEVHMRLSLKFVTRSKVLMA